MADHETIIETRGSSPLGVIAGILFVVAIVLGVVWFFGNQGGGTRTVDIDVPAVSVNVQPDGQ